MNDPGLATDNRNVITIAHSVQKIMKSIKEKRKSKITSDDGKKDIAQLISLCKSENTQISLLSVQCFVQLASDNLVDITQCLTIFMSIIPNASFNHYTIASEGITELLLLELKRQCANPAEKYVNKYGIKVSPHPLISLVNKDSNQMNLLMNKILNILNHHDEVIRAKSIEFLRPVLLYTLCNTDSMPHSNKLWNCLLKFSNSDANQVVYDVMCWSKVSTAPLCQATLMMIEDCIKLLMQHKKYPHVNELCIYYAAVTKHSIQYGFDPRINFCVIMSILHSNAETDHYSILAMILSEMLQNISPIYVPELLRILKYIVVKNAINFLSLYMIMDGLLQWLAFPSFISRKLDDATFIINYITELKYQDNAKYGSTRSFKCKDIMLQFHPDIAIYYDVSLIFEESEINNFNNMGSILSKLKRKTFCQRIDLILRGLFLCECIGIDNWNLVFKLLMDMFKSNENCRGTFLISFLYKLANVDQPRQVLLLQSLCTFGAKNQVLNTIKSIANEIDKCFSIDLYLRLWKAEPRTYPFLYDILRENNKIVDNQYEYDITIAYAIKEVCLIKPSQHGADLIGILSDILSRALTKHEEVAASLALDAIALLCENHVVNVVSTWKAISFKLQFESGTRVLRSLCNFFSLIPNLHSPTKDYQALYDEVVERLWNFIIKKNDSEIYACALSALKSFPLESLRLKHLPAIFRVPPKQAPESIEPEEIDLDTEIHPECWVQVLQQIDKSVINEFGDIVKQYISLEIAEFRGGVYLIPEGKPEPDTLKYLPSTSVLRVMVQLVLKLVGRDIGAEKQHIPTQILRILSVKYSKPIPPLNWNFLIEYFDTSEENRRYCLEIAANQLQISGSAKRFLENYLISFPNKDEEIIWMYKILPVIMADMSTGTFKTFFENSFDAVYDRPGGIKYDTQFELVLNLLKPVVVIKNCANVDNVNCVLEKVETCFNKLVFNDQTFQRFTELFCLLPLDYIKNNLSCNSETNIMKSIYILCKLPSQNKTVVETLELLNIILDDIFNASESVHKYFFSCFIELITTYDDERQLDVWMQGLLVKIENLLLLNDSVNTLKCLFYFDLFVINVIIISGYHFALSNNHDSAERLLVFPQCLFLLFQQNIWRDSETKIYEFLLHLHNKDHIPVSVVESIKKALISCKNQSYFQRPNVWSKFLSFSR